MSQKSEQKYEESGQNQGYSPQLQFLNNLLLLFSPKCNKNTNCAFLVNNHPKECHVPLHRPDLTELLEGVPDMIFSTHYGKECPYHAAIKQQIAHLHKRYNIGGSEQEIAQA